MDESDHDDETGSQADEALDLRAARKELRRLRNGREALGMRVRMARQELARTRRRQKEAEKAVAEIRGKIAAISQRLGIRPGGMTDLQEWKEISYEHTMSEKRLRKQIQEDEEAHAVRLKELQDEIQEGGRPKTARSAQAAQSKRLRELTDEECGRVQAVHDYVLGKIDGDISLDELWQLVGPNDGSEADCHPDDLRRRYEDVLSCALEWLQTRHQESVRDLKQLYRRSLSHKDVLLEAMASDVIGRGLQDLKLCTPAEHSALRELMKDVQVVCAGHIDNITGADRQGH
mmetsp:Transcript_14648/g.43787  ORF Transcript_14648/g.43787 Transcript_14648/m.43787 type:complete len:289 (-) Transcript_14648:74-940(-)